ncbi:uncharacterized protein LOC127246911 [Andrographis paniculata]|uniref:uncharacterized protein LOC127246911 n=1 Tax=Andrographis paniculata TaxID=175694 RepID=UPI0021E86AC4|nr:uncharacterized protein LOC127246911 [Andrographis paniculata]
MCNFFISLGSCCDADRHVSSPEKVGTLCPCCFSSVSALSCLPALDLEERRIFSEIVLIVVYNLFSLLISSRAIKRSSHLVLGWPFCCKSFIWMQPFEEPFSFGSLESDVIIGTFYQMPTIDDANNWSKECLLLGFFTS